MNLTLIAGARPNFMKIAPIIHAIQKAQQEGINIHYRLVHTGQHYDGNMSEMFFEELDIPRTDINLGCGGGSQAEQTAAIMVAFEKDLIANPSDLVMVVGDVTSTMACSIVAKKLNTKVTHVEAGIRSWNLTMPEEINCMLTLHRPAKALMNAILSNEHGLPVIFPIHPRTAKIFTDIGIHTDNLHVVDPMGYLEFNYLVQHSKAVITDSGGITEEKTVMGIPCITLRDNTERPETCTIGTNELIGTNPSAIKQTLDNFFAGEWKKG